MTATAALFVPGAGRRAVARCAAVTGVPEAELLGRSRARAVAVPRFAVMWALRGIGWSHLRIGALLSRDHSVSIHGERRAAALIAAGDARFIALVGEIEAAVRDVAAFAAPAIVAAPPPPPPPPPALDGEEIEFAARRRAMAKGSLLLARAIRAHRAERLAVRA